MDNKIDILLSEKSLSLDDCYNFVVDESCGGICVFVGTVRNHNKGEDVRHLDFESYGPMAIKEMQKIARYCIENLDCKKAKYASSDRSSKYH